MAYNEHLANEVWDHLLIEPGADQRKMFGGIAFVIDGNLACGVSGDLLFVRLNPSDAIEALTHPEAREFDLSGKPMKGWVLIDPAELDGDDDLKRWIDRGLAYAQTFPPKTKIRD